MQASHVTHVASGEAQARVSFSLSMGHLAHWPQGSGPTRFRVIVWQSGVCRRRTSLMSSPERRLDGFSASPFWAAVTIVMLGALYEYALSGLYLLGFLAVVVVTHEGGHYVFARRAGMKPVEFFWGFGPEVFGFNFGGCRFGLKAIFLGGYVRIWGMTPSSELPEGVREEDTYRHASIGGRLATILAGPMVNLVSAVVAFAVAALLLGATPLRAVGFGFEYVWLVLTVTLDSLALFAKELIPYVEASVTGVQPPVRFTSPISQASLSADAVKGGVAQTLLWFGILSAAVGFFNLLPLVPLDGAHALVAAGDKFMQVVRRDRSIRLDVRRLEPFGYLTIGLILILSVGAFVMDLRDQGVLAGYPWRFAGWPHGIGWRHALALELALGYGYIHARRARTQNRPIGLRSS